MQTYARVQNGVVLEVLATDQTITKLFHPDLVWVPVPQDHQVAPGWRYDGVDFSQPLAAQTVAEAPSLHSVMAALANVQEQLAALKSPNP